MIDRPGGTTEAPWLPGPDYQRVLVLCTARTQHPGPRRLPDRVDAAVGPIAAIQVTEAAEALDVFAALDRPGLTVYVDVERKQPMDLPRLARQTVRYAAIRGFKPNDVTVRAVQAVVDERFGLDLTGIRVGVVGTGNLAFKIALLLAECDASVLVAGRREDRVGSVLETLRTLIPPHHAQPPRGWDPQDRVDLLVTAVSAPAVLDAGWVDRLASPAVVLDVGIGNLSREFVASAVAAGCEVARLDTRATGAQVAAAAPGFFERLHGRGVVAGVPVVSGGVIGPRGTVVVDGYADPSQVVGIADGSGGLVDRSGLSDAERGLVARVEDWISRGQTRPRRQSERARSRGGSPGLGGRGDRGEAGRR